MKSFFIFTLFLCFLTVHALCASTVMQLNQLKMLPDESVFFCQKYDDDLDELDDIDGKGDDLDGDFDEDMDDEDFEEEEFDEEERELIRMIDEISKKVEKEKPELWKKIEEKIEREGEEAEMMLEELGLDLHQTYKHLGQKAFDLECSIIMLNFKMDNYIMEYHAKKNDKSKPKIAKELSGVLSELFDLKIKRREMQIVQMENELGDLRKSIESARKNKKQQVEQYLKKLTSQSTSPFDW